MCNNHVLLSLNLTHYAVYIVAELLSGLSGLGSYSRLLCSTPSIG